MKKTLTLLFALATLPALSVSVLAQTTATTTEAAKPADLTSFAGTYSFPEGSPISKFTVLEKDGQLYGEADTYGSNKLEKQPETDTYKSTSSYGSIIVFNRDPGTKAVVSLTLKVQGQELVAKKTIK